ncbi:MAG: response regulator [Oxalobacteraceae bacterium]|nr:response regulator [Oxalobacteraceae bacterium]
MARILIIEDNPTNMALMEYLLGAFGYSDVRSAADGEEGWQAAQQEPFDLIVCDVHLPKRDGYEVLRLLKGDPKLQAIPVIAVSALAMVGDREKMLEAGFDGYIGKPIEPATFVSQIEQFLPPALRAQRPAETEPAPEAALTSAADTAPPLALKGATILVVDDSPVNRELIRSTLEPFGYTLLFAEDVQQGWQRAQNNRFDLVVCDLHMPDEDGFSFIRRLRTDSRLASIPFMFLTASSGCDSDPGQAQALGAARFLRRPIEPQALVDQIDACLREVDEKGG